MRVPKNSIAPLFLVLAIFSLAGIAACGSEAKTDGDLSAQERLLSWLPADTTDFGFADIEIAQSRPGLREEPHGRLSDIFERTENALGKELFNVANIKNGAFGSDREARMTHDVAILEGEFQELISVLEQSVAGTSGDQLDVKVIEIYRSIEIFTISRRSGRPPEPVTIYMGVTDRHLLALAHNLKSVKKIIDQQLNTGRSPDPFFGGLQTLVKGSVVLSEIETYRGVVIYGLPSSTMIYLAVMDDSKLVLSFSAGKVIETVDRILDGADISPVLQEILEELGRPDFLYAVPVDWNVGGGATDPFAAVTFQAFAVSFNDGGMSAVSTRFSFDEPEQAVVAADWMESEGHTEGLFFVNNDSVGTARVDGRSIISEAIVPDEEVISMLFGDD